MEESDPQKQQRVGKGSSVPRKPFSDLTNLVREPHRRSTSFSHSKKPIIASAMSSTGSTRIHSLVQRQFTAPRDQHPLPTPRPRTPSPVALNVAHSQKPRYDSVHDGKHIAYSGSQTMMKSRSKIKATPTIYEVNGTEDSSQSNSAKVQKRTHSSKRSFKKYVLPQDFIDQQRAYFKEIDEYELEVEEEDELSD